MTRKIADASLEYALPPSQPVRDRRAPFVPGLPATIKQYNVLLSYPLSHSIKLNDDGTEFTSEGGFALDPRLKK